MTRDPSIYASLIPINGGNALVRLDYKPANGPPAHYIITIQEAQDLMADIRHLLSKTPHPNVIDL